MSSYSAFFERYVLKDIEPVRSLAVDAQLVRAGALRRGAASRLYKTADRPHAVVLALHGFTAGVWQFDELASTLVNAGFAVFAPRLPGHGCLQEGRETAVNLPCSGAAASYRAFADRALREACDIAAAHGGASVDVVGFSAGGTLACDLLQRRGSQIHRAVLLAPFFSLAGAAKRAFVHTATACGSLVARGFDHVPVGGQGRRRDLNLRVGQVLALATFARSVRACRTPLAPPTRIIVNCSDQVVRRRCIETFFRRRCRGAPHALVHIPAFLKVPHAALSPEEYSDSPTRAYLHELIVAHLQIPP